METECKDLEESDKNAGMKAILMHKHKTEALIVKKSEWKVSRSAIFVRFWSHCRAKMKTKLSDVEDWTKLVAEQDRMKLIKLIDQLIRS